MNETINNPSKTQQEYLAWFKSEKTNGLKDIKFFPWNLAQATVDSFIEESNTVDRAIKNKQISPLPENM